MAGKHAVYLVATLGFDSMAAITAAMASPRGQATAADLANFAMAGVDIFMGETSNIGVGSARRTYTKPGCC